MSSWHSQVSVHRHSSTEDSHATRAERSSQENSIQVSTTVHILKKFGAETTGVPFSFYRGTVTPMRLTREAFWNSYTGGQI